MAGGDPDVLPAHLGLGDGGAWTAGALPQPEIAVEWAPPRFESVNPLQDVTAD